MKQILVSGLLSLLTVFLLPVAKPEPVQEPEDLVLFIQEALPAKTVRLLDGEAVLELEEEAYLTAVVLCEMPASFEPEALKAQAVAARTFLRRKETSPKHEVAHVCGSSACCQAWESMEALEARFSGTDMEKARAAVRQTRDEVLLYEGTLIDATYFSCSGGRTEAAVAVWGSDVPYLQSVKSFGEEAAPRYESEAVFSPDEFAARLGADLSGPADTWLGPVTYTDGGGVEFLTIGGKAYSGTDLRHIFGLNSTDFDLVHDGTNLVFFVRGFGHRVGMSQYGANFMAKQGWDYRQILTYYYKGAEVKKSTLD